MRSSVLTIALAFGLVTSLTVSAQNPRTVDQKASFDVASIRPNNGGRPFPITNLRGATYTSTSVTLQTLINIAYELRAFQLVGGPEWLNTERFDVVATAPATPPPTLQSIRPMLRSLLEDRFGLVTHQEARDLPVYRLVLARSDQKLGPRLQKVETDCTSNRGNAVTSLGAPPPQRAQPCTTQVFPGRIMMGAMPFQTFFRNLQTVVDRPLIDQTGLMGQYDLDLEWAARADDATKPSIFTALQEQLGLKLESTRGAVDVLVIDRAGRPTPN